MVMQTLNQDTTSNEDSNLLDEIVYRKSNKKMTTSQVLQDEMEMFGLNESDTDEDNEENGTSDLALMVMSKENFRSKFKYDLLEDDTWIRDTGASTHMTNSNEGMFGCTPATNQYIKIGSGERLEIIKKGCKRCTIIQK